MTFHPSASPEATVRRLIRCADRAALSTVLPVPDETPWPFASLVMLACDHDATPILLMSDLSEHARNIGRDPRASLLIDGTMGLKDALTGPRATLIGDVVKDADPVLRRRYLSRHPSAGFYAGFTDFNIYRFKVRRAHLIAGFGKVHWIDAAALSTDADWREIEPALIERLANQANLIAALTRSNDATAERKHWKIVGIDQEGIDMRAEGQVRRLDFPSPVSDPMSLEAILTTIADGKRRDIEQAS